MAAFTNFYRVIFDTCTLERYNYLLQWPMFCEVRGSCSKCCWRFKCSGMLCHVDW